MVVEFVYFALGHLYNNINFVPKANSQSYGFYFTTYVLCILMKSMDVL